MSLPIRVKISLRAPSPIGARSLEMKVDEIEKAYVQYFVQYLLNIIYNCFSDQNQCKWLHEHPIRVNKKPKKTKININKNKFKLQNFYFSLEIL